MRPRYLPLVVAAAAWLVPAAAQACSVCVGPGADEPMTRGLSRGMLFLMAMPYLIIGSVAGCLAYLYRRAAGRRGGRARLLGLSWIQGGNGR